MWKEEAAQAGAETANVSLKRRRDYLRRVVLKEGPVSAERCGRLTGGVSESRKANRLRDVKNTRANRLKI